MALPANSNVLLMSKNEFESKINNLLFMLNNDLENFPNELKDYSNYYFTKHPILNKELITKLFYVLKFLTL